MAIFSIYLLLSVIINNFFLIVDNFCKQKDADNFWKSEVLSS